MPASGASTTRFGIVIPPSSQLSVSARSCTRPRVGGWRPCETSSVWAERWEEAWWNLVGASLLWAIVVIIGLVADPSGWLWSWTKAGTPAAWFAAAGYAAFVRW